MRRLAILLVAALSVPEAVAYAAGKRVSLFLLRFPDGESRTVGWSRGKFVQCRDGRMHGAGTAAQLEGLTPAAFRAKLAGALR